MIEDFLSMMLDGLEGGWRIAAVILICVVLLFAWGMIMEFGIWIGLVIMIVGIIALIISFFGFLIFDSVDFSFKKPLYCIGAGILTMLIGWGHKMGNDNG